MKTLYEFQEEAVQLILKAKGGYLVLDECGLGKTLMGVEVIKRASYGDPLPNLVVSPQPVRFQWLFTLMDQVPDMPHDMIATREELVPEDFHHRRITYITHFEAMVRQMSFLKKIYWNVVICDEAHRIRNRQADRTVALKYLQARIKLALTGTPMEQTPADMWSILNWIRPDKFKGYWSFYERYAMTEPGFGGHVRTVRGCKDIQGLAKEVAGNVIGRTRQQVAPQVPAIIPTPINLIMTPQQKKLYKAIDEATDVLVKHPDTDETMMVRNAMTRLLRLQQVTSNPRLLEFKYSEVPSVKEDWVVEWFKDNPHQSVIVFVQFRQTVHSIASRIPGVHKLLGQRASGATKIVDYTKVNQIIATIAAAGEGIDLPHINTAIFVDTAWSFTKMKQATDRIQRLGVTIPKQIIFLTCVNTVDETIIKAVEEKWTQHRLAMEVIHQYHAKHGNGSDSGSS